MTYNIDMRAMLMLLPSLLAITVSPTFAGVPCFDRGVKNMTKDLIAPVAIFGKEDRRTEDEFATENSLPVDQVKARFAATGTLDCPFGIASASLAVKNNVIVTAAHTFITSSCAKNGDPKRCVFKTEANGKQITRRVKSVKLNGFVPCRPESLKDYAVLELDSPIEDVTPYQIESDTNRRYFMDDRVVHVAASSKDFERQGKDGKIQNPKHIGRCKARTGVSQGNDEVVTSDCDADEGSSGGAFLLDRSGPPVLIGITKSISKSSSTFIPIQNELLQTLKRMGDS